MRIIGGEFRSRQILAPKSDATRPITDRVKQSLFDVLSGAYRRPQEFLETGLESQPRTLVEALAWPPRGLRA